MLHSSAWPKKHVFSRGQTEDLVMAVCFVNVCFVNVFVFNRKIEFAVERG